MTYAINWNTNLALVVYAGVVFYLTRLLIS